MLTAVMMLLFCGDDSKPVSPEEMDYEKTMQIITDAWTKNCVIYKKLNGELNTVILDISNNLVKWKQVIRFDGINCLCVSYYGYQLVSVTISRNINGVQQLANFRVSPTTSSCCIRKSILRRATFTMI